MGGRRVYVPFNSISVSQNDGKGTIKDMCNRTPLWFESFLSVAGLATGTGRSAGYRQGWSGGGGGHKKHIKNEH